MKILFIDDEKFAAKNYLDELESKNHEITYATTADEAIKIFNTDSDIELIILIP